MPGDGPVDAGDAYAWLDDAAGPLVRSFAIAGGRTHDGADFDLLTHVVTTTAGERLAARVPPEQRAILRLAERPTSVAEVASHLDLPVGVVRVLLGDLRRAGAIDVEEPTSVHRPPADHVLDAMIDGLRSL